MTKLCTIVLLILVLSGCRSERDEGTVVTFPASSVGQEMDILRSQIDRFHRRYPRIRVEFRRTPDASDQRHQLYVQWLNARASDPDILQLDVVWTPEFAAAGWLLPLDRFAPETADFFPAAVRANSWKGSLYAVPWFVDIGMLYYRTDMVPAPPASFEELSRMARESQAAGAKYGFLWQGARYEGLVCVFLEIVHGFGGAILDDAGRVTVDARESIDALMYLIDTVHGSRISPEAVLTWQEEQTRFAFQNGDAAFMRNWPYAYPLLQSTEGSGVAGRFGIAPMPATERGSSSAALGGSQLAINVNTAHPREAYLVVDFLTQPEQMLERAAKIGQFPARRSLYEREDLRLTIPREHALELVDKATPRPVTPVYTELSEILQIWLHRALTQQVEPEAALGSAASEMRALLAKVGLSEAEP